MHLIGEPEEREHRSLDTDKLRGVETPDTLVHVIAANRREFVDHEVAVLTNTREFRRAKGNPEQWSINHRGCHGEHDDRVGGVEAIILDNQGGAGF